MKCGERRRKRWVEAEPGDALWLSRERRNREWFGCYMCLRCGFRPDEWFKHHPDDVEVVCDCGSSVSTRLRSGRARV